MSSSTAFPTPELVCDRCKFNSEQNLLLQQIADNTKTMCVKLFGATNSDIENDTGRLPKVEASAKSAHKRIDETDLRINVLDNRIVWASGFAAAIGAIVSLVGSAIIAHVWR